MAGDVYVSGKGTHLIRGLDHVVQVGAGQLAGRVRVARIGAEYEGPHQPFVFAL